jgi:hypothetical protein
MSVEPSESRPGVEPGDGHGRAGPFNPPSPRRNPYRFARSMVLGFTLVLLVLTIIWLVNYRPPLPPYRAEESAGVDSSLLPIETPTMRVPDRPSQPTGPLELARSSLASLDTVYQSAVDRWTRARGLHPVAALDSAGAAEAVTRFRRAQAIADSVRSEMVWARAQIEWVREASRTAPSGLGYRLSVVYTAAGRWLDLLTDEADDQYQYVHSMEEATSALAQGDVDGFEVKQNVAGSHRRRSDARQRSIRRQQGQLEEAVRSLPGGTR